MSPHRLRHQHPQTVVMGNAQRPGLQQQTGLQRVVDQIEHKFQLVKPRQVQCLALHIRMHASGGGIDHHRCIRIHPGCLFWQDAAFRLLPVDRHRTAPQGLDHRLYSRGSPAASEHQDSFISYVNPGMFQSRQDPRAVGVLAIQPSAAVDHTVHRLCPLRQIRYLVTRSQSCLLVGNRHIDPRKFPGLKKFIHPVPGHFPQNVSVVSKPAVNLF